MTITIASNIIRISRERHTEAADVLAEAFATYPLMRYCFGHLGAAYRQAVRALFHFSCARRLAIGEPLLGSMSETRLVGVAGVNLPGSEQPSEALDQAYERFKALVGPEATMRFGQYAQITEAHRPTQPHLTLGVLGVLPQAHGGGHGRALLNAVQALCEAHPTATGVYLDTETSANVALYQHFGYEVIAHEQVGDVDIWCMFRPTGAKIH